MSAPLCCYDEPMTRDGLVWHCPICRAWHWVRQPEPDDPYLTGREVAALLGVSVRQVWRYVNETGDLPPRETWRRSTIEPLKDKIAALAKRKGRARNPHAVRYTTGRHRFDKAS